MNGNNQAVVSVQLDPSIRIRCRPFPRGTAFDVTGGINKPLWRITLRISLKEMYQ